jgi:hypothetical protein
LISLPIFTPFYCSSAGVMRGVLPKFTKTPATLHKSHCLKAYLSW